MGSTSSRAWGISPVTDWATGTPPSGSRSPQTTSVGSRQTAESVGYLARLADQLRLSVATFKLNKSEA